MSTLDQKCDARPYGEGRLVREEWYYADSEVADEVRVHAYDAAGREVTSERRDGEGIVLEFRSMTYDEAGNLLREDLGRRTGHVHAVIDYSWI